MLFKPPILIGRFIGEKFGRIAEAIGV